MITTIPVAATVLVNRTSCGWARPVRVIPWRITHPGRGEFIPAGLTIVAGTRIPSRSKVVSSSTTSACPVSQLRTYRTVRVNSSAIARTYSEPTAHRYPANEIANPGQCFRSLSFGLLGMHLSSIIACNKPGPIRRIS